jgi:thioredoxin-like negative regulator of GroEL
MLLFFAIKTSKEFPMAASLKNLFAPLAFAAIFAAPVAAAAQEAGATQAAPKGDVPMLNDQTLPDALRDAQGPVLVEFKASWCPWCRKEEPVIAAIAKEQAGKLTVYSVDTEESPKAARDNRVRGLPVMVIFYQGKELDRSIGYFKGSELRGWIRETVSGLNPAPAHKRALAAPKS